MIKPNHWLNALFALVFIAIPALIGFYFWLPDWNNDFEIGYWFYWVISLAFVAYVAVLSFFMIKLKILSIDIITFYLPLTFVFMAIFISFDWSVILRFFIVIIAILTALPANMFVVKIKDRYRQTILKKRKKYFKTK